MIKNMLVNTPAKISAVTEINERNRQFWLAQSVLLNERMQSESLYEFAMEVLADEGARMVPVKNRVSLEGALGRAETSMKLLHKGMARKGGKAAKTDVMQSWIEQVVREEKNISARELFTRYVGWPKVANQSLTR